MAFLKRLGFYLVGLSIGIVFLTLFLKKKSDETGTEFCYFPNCRTLKSIRSKPMSFSEEVNKLIVNQKLDSVDIMAVLHHGDVNFSKSDTQSVPCKTYYINGVIRSKQVSLTVKNCINKAVLEEIITQ
ncbi:DUF4258 domain-containing protein [Pareuzebyella sediminis]|uniref:DUF4258 domain-containing protein n=1 Tax=Pareuzebyella sediminis TaxID=2607998 RepID=UPI0011F03036|nr:DUF4258 domain-containing protein [Pareuzebyella sediminis]